MTPSQIIVLATPVFFLLIAVEWWVAQRRRLPVYRLADAVSSISLGMLSQTSAVFTRVLRIGLYTLVFEHVALWRHDAFWTSLPGWVLALLFYDFCYYWLHRMGHESAVLWAAHAVHHQSQDYNLSTALRQTSSGALLGWVFYLPMALAGVPPLVFAVVGLIDLLYQFWVHTELVPRQTGRWAWFDRWFCSPSNHRVHHAVNDPYLDKNYGGVLIVWDRLFGTFKDEDPQEKCVYGTRGLLNSWDPLWANTQVYAGLLHDSWHARRWTDKLRVWLKPPGWRPADVAERFPKPAFSLAAVQRFDPPMTPGIRRFAAVQFVLLLAGVAAFLWQADSAALGVNLVGFAVLLVWQWALGALMQGRLHWLEMLTLQCGALAMATSAWGWVEAHRVFKPLTMAIAIIFVASRAYQTSTSSPFGTSSSAPAATRRGVAWLLLALAASLAGDAFLMFEGFFVPGLASFLLAHLAYIALLRRDAPWFASRAALAVPLAVGAVMYAVLWTGGLPAGLRAPVAVYVLVIALMAAQALGRALHLRTRAAWLVAAGAVCFMVSDAVLAIHRFVQPLPLSALWVLGTYYAAQALIVGGWVRQALPALTPVASRG
ncbi:MAG: lysoplasmalogenase family protein [Burkholderiaceae bacterium]